MSDNKTEELMVSLIKKDEDNIRRNLKDILKKKVEERFLSEIDDK